MPVYDKKDFDKVLEQIEQGNISPLYLLYGEDYLVKSAVNRLTRLLVPDSQRNTNLELVDGGQADFRQILDSVNTFALFGGRKVVAVQDCRIFYSRANVPALVAKSRKAHAHGDLESASRLLVEVLGHAGWSVRDVAEGAWQQIPVDMWEQIMGVRQEEAELQWLEEVAAVAARAHMTIPGRTGDSSVLEEALEERFPFEHCLILTTDTVDKKRSLYRLIEEKGIVADFSVLSGGRRKARSEQETVLRNLAEETFSAAGKDIEPQALSLLIERTGFNLWALKTQAEKLVSFVGDETLVTREHAEKMSEQFREEALYELNNAVAERDCEAALLSVNRLLQQNYHPLQLLASLATEIRRLLAAREFIHYHLANGLNPRISYGSFQKTVLPVVKEKTEKGSPLAGLHPFALHKTMVRSTNYQTDDLINSLHLLFKADLTLKSTSIAERAVLESLIVRLCQL
jgi:DNA polymerase-3 subunit delta